MVRVLIEELKQYARDNHVPIMQDGGIEFILNYIKKYHVKKILEIGSAIGYSAISFASISDDITVTTIERDDKMYQKAIENIRNAQLSNRITIIHGDATYYAKWEFIQAAALMNGEYYSTLIGR